MARRKQRPDRFFQARFAWWYLNQLQKQLLADQRQAGRFGGDPARRPRYWMMVEEGAEGGEMPVPGWASVPGKHYIARTAVEMRSRLRSALVEYMQHV